MTAPATVGAAPQASRNLSDQRRALRESLRRHVHGSSTWAEPSLAIFRNRLLDDVGSDARPLANLLLEALSRGVDRALPREPLSPLQWNARCTSFVMRWVGERFIQPEAARWAVESWAFAFGAISSAQLTAFVDEEDEPDTPERSGSGTFAADGGGTTPSAAGAPPLAAGATTPPGGPNAGRKRKRSASALPRATQAPTGVPAGAAARGASGGAAARAGRRSGTRPGYSTASGAGYGAGYGGAAANRNPPSRNAALRASSAHANRLARRMTAAVLGTLTVGVLALAVQVARGPSPAETARAARLAAARVDSGRGAQSLPASAQGTPNASDPALVDSLRAALGGEPQFSSDIAYGGPPALTGEPGSAPVTYPAPNSATGLGGQATVVPLAPGNGRAPSLAMTRLPAVGATPRAFQELAERSRARQLAEAAASGGAGSPADAASNGTPAATATPAAPGVPGITPNALPLDDQQQASVRRVRPATRPARQQTAGRGATVAPRSQANAARARTTPPRTTTSPSAPPQAAPSSAAPSSAAPSSAAPSSTAPSRAPTASPSAASLGLDEIRLESGRVLRGRVDVIRASSVVFRDAETGLRYEFPKDDISEIVAEFGNSVRFRAADGAKPGSTNDRRTRSVAGRYVLSYEAARVDGAPACRDLWRGSSQSDVANVTHLAGADTLTIAFEGGDNFPSIMDADGFFSSTFRVMAGQAELATALTTRLNGGFSANGGLAMQITVIGYRRVQGTRGVACQITVQANGTRTDP